MRRAGSVLFFGATAASPAQPDRSRKPDGAAQAVVLEGVAEEVSDSALLTRLAEVYSAKYPLGFPPGEPIYAVRPRVAFGQSEDDFTGSATRWRFDD